MIKKLHVLLDGMGEMALNHVDQKKWPISRIRALCDDLMAVFEKHDAPTEVCLLVLVTNLNGLIRSIKDLANRGNNEKSN